MFYWSKLPLDPTSAQEVVEITEKKTYSNMFLRYMQFYCVICLLSNEKKFAVLDILKVFRLNVAVRKNYIHFPAATKVR